MLSMLRYIANQFELQGCDLSIELFGHGHINDTYIVTTKQGASSLQYILQKINTYVFTEPEHVMENIMQLTDYLRHEIMKQGGDPQRETLTFVRARSGQYYFQDETGFWRMYHFVDNVTCYSIATPELLYHAGKAVGTFQRRLNAFDVSRLWETIPKFHDSENRYKNFEAALKEDSLGRASSCQAEIDFIQSHQALCSKILSAVRSGDVPLRVCHNDTKLDNILFHNDTMVGCIIDLDTTMQGTLLYDFGDSIRAGASTAAEDEADLSIVSCDLEKYASFTKGFSEECGNIMTDAEWELLPYGAQLMTFENGMRFLTDYLSGDQYYRISYPEHNLVRARNQICLVRDMEAKHEQILSMIRSYRSYRKS